LEDRTLLTVNVGVVNTDASNLLQWELDNDDLAGGFGGGSEFSFDYGLRSGAPGAGAGGDDVALVGDFNNIGFDQGVVVREVSGGLQWLGDTDRDTDQEYLFRFGLSDHTPLIGDLNGDGHDDIVAVDLDAGSTLLEWYVHYWDPTGGTDYFNDFTVPISATFSFGLNSGHTAATVNDIPVVGDFSGDGRADVGAVRNDGANFDWFHAHAAAGANPYPNNTPTTLNIDNTINNYGSVAFDVPVVGDWDNDGDDNIGVADTDPGEAFIDWNLDTNGGGAAELSYQYGSSGDQLVVGNWADVYWDGAGNFSGDGLLWSDPGNWSSGAVPDSMSSVVIDQPGSATVVVHDAGITNLGSLNSFEALSVTGGFLTIDGDSSADSVAVGGGLLTVNGSLASTVSVSGGTLAGSGTVSSAVTVSASGVIAPGNSPGILNTGNFDLQAGSTLEIEFGGSGANPGIDYDQVNVTGTVTLAGTLDVIPYSSMTAAVDYVIINNDGLDVVSGTFAGLAEGATVSDNGSEFTISYVGGDGNDVTLTPLNQTYVVTNTDEIGPGSLEQAIVDANSFPGHDAVAFNIAGVGPHTIGVVGSLPAITDTVTIDGYTQPGASANTLLEGNDSVLGIILDGTMAPAATGLEVNGISAAGTTISGLEITNFSTAILGQNTNNLTVEGNHIHLSTNFGVYFANVDGGTIGGDSVDARNTVSGTTGNGIGVRVSGTSANNVVSGNYVGTDRSGTSIDANLRGLLIDGGAGNTLGGTTAAERNLISGNTNVGIQVDSGSTIVIGNFIGTDAAGSTALANGVGVTLAGIGSRIGGPGSEGNVISGNTFRGIDVNDAAATGMKIQGNLIGLNAAGTAAIPNGADGILAARGIVLIGTDGDGVDDAAERNVVSGNSGDGIELGTTIEATVAGNLIGLATDGTTAIANAENGVRVTTSGSATIGGLLPAETNVISGNSSRGIRVIGASVMGTQILGNLIGTTADGLDALGNVRQGIQVDGGSNGTTIGDGSTAGRNVIAGNGLGAIAIFSSPNTSISGNYIGTDVNGEDTTIGGIGNGGDAVSIASTAALIDSNVIANAGGGAIFLGNDTGSTIIGNTIGLNAAGNTALPNSSGIVVSTGSGVTIGGSAVGNGNVISSSNNHGITLNNNSTGIEIQGNMIGLNAAGDTAFPNGSHGIFIESGSSNNTIGGSTPGERNVISGNNVDGISLDGAGTGNRISGNYIGTNAAGDATVPNGQYNISLVNGSDGTIIGTNGDGSGDAGEGNVIAGHAVRGINIDDSDNVVIAGNFIGINAAGDTSLQSAISSVGVYAESSSGLRIGTDANGTSDVEERNVISGHQGNQGRNIFLNNNTGPSAIAGNYIGVDSTGLLPIDPLLAVTKGTGILVSGSDGDQIGGSSPAQRNIIGGLNIGIQVTARDFRIQGNYIGVGPDGVTDVGVDSDGVDLLQTAFGFVGTDGDGIDDAAEGNVISGNGTGVDTSSHFFTTVPRISGNIIGLDATGTIAVPNNVGVTARRRSIIGTDGDGVSDSLERNIISGNTSHGVFIDPSTNTEVIVAGNYIGLLPDGVTPAGNGGSGVFFDSGIGGQTIGGDIAAERNVIAANTGAGISFTTDSDAVVLDNLIGTAADGVTVVPGQTSALEIGGTAISYINGFLSASEGVVVSSTGTLGGSGTIDGPVVAESGATVAPGNSPGILNTGDFTFADGATFEVEIGGTTAGNTNNDHDQLNVTGTVTIGDNVTLDTQQFLTFVPTSGDEFTIINNDGSDAVSGTFAGLPEGSLVGNFMGLGRAATISYVGGDGNDVVLTDAGISYVVVNTNDSGAGSLRQAIMDANANPGRDNIVFNIPGAGVHVINPASDLPTITDPVQLDASSQPGYTNSPLVAIDRGANALTDGLVITGGDSVVKGLMIYGFDSGNGITITTNGGNVIQGNYIGTDGTNASANNRGIWIQDSDSNVIGGDYMDLSVANVISGNRLGLTVVDSALTQVSGNFIGLDPTGQQLLANTSTGIVLNRATQTVIGTNGDGDAEVAERNFFAGGDSASILVTSDSAAASQNVIANNYIGTDIDGTENFAAGRGIVLNDAGTRVGTDADGVSDVVERNLINGDTEAISLDGNGGHTVAGNWIGIDVTGAVAYDSGVGVGVDIKSSGNLIGGSTVVERNVISGHESGLGFETGAAGNRVSGNYIGTDTTGLLAVPNTGTGILITEDAGANIFGTDFDGLGDATEGNVVSGNGSSGFVVLGASQVIAGNIIGLGADGNTVLGQTIAGVSLGRNATGSVVGGSDDSQRNVISGNGHGVEVAVGGVHVAGNYIGTDISGSLNRGNTGFGVLLQGGASVVGGNAVGEGNVISGNAAEIFVGGADTGSRIQGNYIGTSSDGLALLSTASGIITDSNGVGLVIGVDGDGIGDEREGNVIVAGGGNAIQIASDDTTIAGNLIGLNANGTAQLGNASTGIRLDTPTGAGTVIGTNGDTVSDTLERNVISGFGTGLRVRAAVTIAGNYIGTDESGTVAIPNGSGILVDQVAPAGVLIGTDGDGVADAAERNVISGNVGDGLEIFADGTVIAGNYIGADATGLVDLGNGRDGVRVAGSGNQIGGATPEFRNVISGNDGFGVFLSGGASSFNTLEGNYIGVGSDGSTALGNAVGVVATGGAFNNFIGTAAAGNTISANLGAGISLGGASTTGNFIQGNIVGLDASGLNPLGNLDVGIVAAGGANSSIIGTDGDGVDDSTEGNVVSSNGNIGIRLVDDGSDDHVVAGNIIGLDITASVQRANERFGGIVITGSDNNRVGSNSDGVSDALERNIISGNLDFGVVLEGADSTTIAGNYIGTDGAGLFGIANFGGVFVLNSTNTLVGGINSGSRNLISGNTNEGVVVLGAGTSNTVVSGNLIGVNESGDGSVPNSVGVRVANGATATRVGGSDPSERNLISGNAGDGVQVQGSAGDVTIQGNWIGLSTSGTAAIPNGDDGIDWSGAGAGSLIGTDGDGVNDVAERNVISGNVHSGLEFFSTIPAIKGNWIGIDAITGQNAIGNATGILAFSANGGVIGVDGDGSAGEANEGNVISGNGVAGINITSSNPALSLTSNVVIAGNFVGTDSTGTQAVPNGLTGSNGGGIQFVRGTNQRVGTNSDGVSDELERNVISGNFGTGLLMRSTGIVAGNYVGTDVTGTKALGNGVGIFVDLPTGSLQIGTNGDGTRDAVEGNVISGNSTGIYLDDGIAAISGNFIGTDATGQIGVGNNIGVFSRRPDSGTAIGGSGALANVVAFNSTGLFGNTASAVLFSGVGQNDFHANALGIDYSPVGPTPNSGAGTFAENFPVLTNAFIEGADLVVEGFAVPGVTFDLYQASPNLTGFGEGETFIATFTEGAAADEDSSSGSYTNADAGGANVGNGSGNRFRFRVPAPAGLGFGDRVTALAAGAEFSNSLLVGEESQQGQPGSSLEPVIFETFDDDGGFVPFSNRVLQGGESLSLLGDFYDPDSLAWTATVDFGDGSGVQSLALRDDFHFNLEHDFPGAGTYTVQIEIVDNTLAVGTTSFVVTVSNEAPVLSDNLFSLTSPLFEGETATLTGFFADSGLTDSHTIEVNWGDGTAPQFYPVPQVGDRTFSASHRYEDDTDLFGTNNTATPVDVYRVQVRVIDQDGGTDDLPNGLLLAEVFNVAPSDVQVNFGSAAVEGQVVTLDGSFVDPGVLDTFEVTVDWGDGSPQDTVSLAAGTTTFSGFNHTYLDNGSYDITVQVADDDAPLSFAEFAQTIAIANEVPNSVSVNVSAPADENGEVTVDGTFADSGSLDEHIVSIDWGDGSVPTEFSLSAGVTSFAGIRHQYRNNLPGDADYPITVSVRDYDDVFVFGTGTQAASVANVAPSIVMLELDSQGPFVEGDTVTLTGQYDDAGLLDRHEVSVVWGDGSPVDVIEVNSEDRTFSATYTYRDNGLAAGEVADLVVSVTDDDGAIATASLAPVVANAEPVASFLPAASNNDPTKILLEGQASDFGVDDSLTYQWAAWRDGDVVPVVGIDGGTTFELNIPAGDSSTWVVSLWVNDDDGGVGTYQSAFVIGTQGPDSLTIDDGNFVSGVPNLTVLSLDGRDLIDATAVSVGNVILDGGLEDDTLFGGTGDDIYFLRGGDDNANTFPGGASGNINPNVLGDDRYFVVPNSTHTVFDDSRSGGDRENSLDFSLANEIDGAGVTFDLSAVDDGSLQPAQDVYPDGNEAGQHLVAAQGSFGELVGSGFDDGLTAATDSTVMAGSGNDKLFVNGGTTGVQIFAGADNDDLLTTGTGIADLSFNGDDGLDTLTNEGTIADLTFGGGADNDELINTGTIADLTFGGGADSDDLINDGGVVETLSFNGDDGLDSLVNTGTVTDLAFGGGADNDELINMGTIVDLTFGGGADSDDLINDGGLVEMLSFNGDDGLDSLTNTGTVVDLTFGGGADDDELINMGTVTDLTFGGGADSDDLINDGGVVTTLTFNGDDGLDSLVNTGTVADLTFGGGADSDDLINDGGVVTTLTFNGDDGLDSLVNTGTVADLTFGGGADSDDLINDGGVVETLTFNGDDGLDTLVNTGTVGDLTFGGGADDDTLLNNGTVVTALSFNGDGGSDLLINSGSVADLTFSGGADGDRFLNTASDVNSITFNGGDGSGAFAGDGDDVFQNEGTNIVTLSFNGDGGDDVFQNNGGSITDLSFNGDDGADLLINSGDGVDALSFGGGADDDTLVNYGEALGTLVFNGDADPNDPAYDPTVGGDDTLIIRGSGAADGIATVSFDGSAGEDAFQNNATGFASILFEGGADNDVFQNNGDGVTDLSFNGDGGDDVFENNGTAVVGLSFNGDSGADVFVNDGAGVADLTFGGGADNDVLVNNGDGVDTLSFNGDGGDDVFINTGDAVANLTFGGGSDDDTLQNTGSGVTGLSFNGDSGDDRFWNRVSGTNATNVTFNGDTGDDLLINDGDGIADLTFSGGADNDGFQNNGAFATNLLINDPNVPNAGDGDDTVINTGAGLAGLIFHAGAGDDQLANRGSNVSGIQMFGGAGDDQLVNDGDGVTDLVFGGGADDDTLINNGLAVDTLSFNGDGGDDIFVNNGDAVTDLTFVGGADDDTLENHGSVVTLSFNGDAGNDVLMNSGDGVNTLSFNGDDGVDTLINTGDDVDSLTFNGGADGDQFRVSGEGLGAVTFAAGAGPDSFNFNGIGAAGSTVVYDAGDDNDFLAWSGTADTADIDGGLGNDQFIVVGAGALDIDGGDGDDYYGFINDPAAEVTISESLGSGSDTLDFSAFTGGPLDLDLRDTNPQSQSALFTIAFVDGESMDNVFGTPFSDVISGNANANIINGAEFFDGFDGPVAGPGGVTQWVLLDFDTETEAGEHVYTQAERDAVEQRIEAAYRGPDAGAPWFDVRVTQDANEIPDPEYVTITFNETPEFGRPGGLASEIDPGNQNLDGHASVQVNGLLGGVVSDLDAGNDDHGHGPTDEDEFKPETEPITDDALGDLKPAGTSENFIALSAKIGAHELGHLLGLRHLDSFGPIGSGVHDPPGAGSFKPQFTGPSGGFETFDHILGSPATVGSTRFDDLNDLFFGEREAFKLAFAFANPDDVYTTESGSSHSTIATAQPLTLSTLAVPNTLSRGVNAEKDLFFQVQSVEGTLALDGATTESDYYSFVGYAGELVNIDVLSNSLARYTDNGNDGYIDTYVRVYDSSGSLVQYYNGFAENDDIFEPTDSHIIDLVLPADDTYYIEVDSFARDASDPLSDPTNPDSPLHPDHPANPANLDINDPEYQLRVDLFDRFVDSANDTDVGNYQLIVYRFDRANTTDDIDSIIGNGGNDTIFGGPGDNFDLVVTPAGNGEIDEGDTFAQTVSILDRAASSWNALVDYGDGSGPQTVIVTPLANPTLAETATIELAHTYLQNGVFLVTIEVTDDIGQTVTQTLTVEVDNVAPTPAIDAIGATREEGSAIAFQGSASDPGVNDLLTYSWNFGDGNSGSGATPTHTYSDNGTYIVILTVSDGDDSTSISESITVNNVAPSITGGSAPITIEEGEQAANSGTFGDVLADTVTLTASLGTVTQNANGTWSWSYDGDDDLAETTVTITATDEDGGQSELEFDVTVNNVAPTATIGNSGPIDEGQTVTVSLTNAADASAIDENAGLRFSFALTPSGLAADFVGGSAESAADFTFNDAGRFTVFGRVIDKDDGITDFTTEVVVNETSQQGSNAVLQPAETIVIEAEHMLVSGFRVRNSNSASNGQIVRLNRLGTEDDIRTFFNGADGRYNVSIFAQDEDDGQSLLTLEINDQVIDAVRLDRDTDGRGSDNGPFSEFVFSDVFINNGDKVEIRIDGDGGEFGRIDRLELTSEERLVRATTPFSDVITDELFSNAAIDWTLPQTETDSSGNAYLGGIGKTSDVIDTANTYRLRQGTEQAVIEFDFLEVDSWDNERFRISINGRVVDLGQFSWRNDEGAGSFNAGNGITVEKTAAVDISGYGRSGRRWRDNDNLHHFRITVDNPGEALQVGFGSTLNQSVSDESWGVDNFLITADGFRIVGDEFSTNVESDDFAAGVAAWTVPQIATDDSGNPYLGGFGKQNGVDTERVFQLPKDTETVVVEFDFLEIDSWNDEEFFIEINDQRIKLGEFDWRDDEEGTAFQVGDGIFVQKSAAVDISGIGANSNNIAWHNDNLHHFRIIVTDPGSHLKLGFDANLSAGADNESWGVDNLSIDAHGVDLLLDRDFDVVVADHNFTGGSTGGFVGVRQDDGRIFYTGGELQLNGNGEYGFIPANNLHDLTSGSVGLTFNAESVSGRVGLFSRDSSDFDGGGHLSIYIHDGNLIVRLQSKSNSHFITGSVPVSANTDHDVQLDFGTGGMQLYLDGVLVGSNSYSGGLAGNDEPIVLGALQWVSGNGVADKLRDHLNGIISDFTIGDGTGNTTGRTEYLGGFGDSDNQIVTRNEFNLPTGTSRAVINFDFLEIDTWNNESLLIEINGRTYEAGRFHWNSDEGSQAYYLDEGIFIEKQLAEDVSGLGGSSRADFRNDNRHRFTITIENPPASKLMIGFGSNLSAPASNESWGIDNFMLRAIGDELIL
jgi:hypothetical protein